MTKKWIISNYWSNQLTQINRLTWINHSKQPLESTIRINPLTEPHQPHTPLPQTFMIVAKDKTMFRFSATKGFFIFDPFHPIRRIALYILTHPYPFACQCGLCGKYQDLSFFFVFLIFLSRNFYFCLLGMYVGLLEICFGSLKVKSFRLPKTRFCLIKLSFGL